jgi:hypothetical protein
MMDRMKPQFEPEQCSINIFGGIMINAKKLMSLFLALASTLLVSCGGGGGGGGGGSTYGSYTSPYVTSQAFVDALNNVDPQYADSYIELYSDETVRSGIIGEEEFFVFYDAKYNEYKAVSLQYVRSIIYYDYYSNNNALADEFRFIEDDDILSGFFDGDPFGDDYEVVDYDFITDLYFGRNSGFAYEDEEETFDVNLMQSDKEKMAFFKKASAISLTYNVSIQTSMSLVTLGKKVEKLIGGNGEITNEDQQALVTDISNLTGVTLEDVTAAQADETKKAELLKKIADKIGSTASNLEHKILPEVFGVNLL